MKPNKCPFLSRFLRNMSWTRHEHVTRTLHFCVEGNIVHCKITLSIILLLKRNDLIVKNYLLYIKFWRKLNLQLKLVHVLRLTVVDIYLIFCCSHWNILVLSFHDWIILHCTLNRGLIIFCIFLYWREHWFVINVLNCCIEEINFSQENLLYNKRLCKEKKYCHELFHF